MTRILLALLLLTALLPAQTAFRDIPLPENPAAVPRYLYRVSLVSVQDGDTCTVNLDLGSHIYTTARFRLYGIDAFELTGPDKVKGVLAKHRLGKLLEGGPIYVVSIRDRKDKYGRMLGVFLVVGHEGTTIVNEAMVAEGLAKYADY